MASKPLVAGNWKMNGRLDSVTEIDAILDHLGEAGSDGPQLMIAPPATLIVEFARRAAGSRLMIGAQDCDPRTDGAHTGDISAEMLADAGAGAVFFGAVVVITMFAARSFDPRLIWDHSVTRP